MVFTDGHIWDPIRTSAERGLREWYRRTTQNPDGAFARMGSATHTRIASNLVAAGHRLMTLSGNFSLAQILQFGDHPLVLLALPDERVNSADLWVIHDVVRSEGGTVLWAPVPALERTELSIPSVEVLDSVPSAHRTRADEQLIRGIVHRPVWGTDPWGEWSAREIRGELSHFLSGYDQNEARASYFLCELPLGARPSTVAEAYQTLKPPSVQIAEAEGRMVKRQGDMFFIRMPWWTPTPASVAHRGFSYRLHRSNHVAEDAIWEGTLTFVQGRIMHAPEDRAPDHATLDLGREYWWLCVRNTVPIVR